MFCFHFKQLFNYRQNAIFKNSLVSFTHTSLFLPNYYSFFDNDHIWYISRRTYIWHSNVFFNSRISLVFGKCLFCISIDAIRDFVIVFDSIHFCLTSTIVDLISVVEGFDDVLEDVNNPVRR